MSAARSAGVRRAKNSSASAARADRMAAARGLGDQGGAPVGWVGMALDEAARLQRVDDLRRRPRRDAQVVRQGAEPDRAVTDEHSQRAGLSRCDVPRGQGGRGLGAQLA